MILSGGTAMIMYENDEIHLTGVGTDDLPRLLDPNDPLNPELHRSAQDFSVFYIGLNVNEPPFDDPKVRQAMNYAIDLQGIAENVLDNRVSQATGVIPPGFPSYSQNLRGYSFNPDLARELLEGSTYADALASGDFPRITLTISGSFGATIPTYLEVMLEQWRALGIEIDIQQTEWATFLQDVNDRKYQMFSLGWIADYPDPENFLDLLFHGERPEQSHRLQQPRGQPSPRRSPHRTRSRPPLRDLQPGRADGPGRRSLGLDLVPRRGLRSHQAGGIRLLPAPDEHTQVSLHLLQPVESQVHAT